MEVCEQDDRVPGQAFEEQKQDINRQSNETRSLSELADDARAYCRARRPLQALSSQICAIDVVSARKTERGKQADL